jgi:hypothetical protein
VTALEFRFYAKSQMAVVGRIPSHQRKPAAAAAGETSGSKPTAEAAVTAIKLVRIIPPLQRGTVVIALGIAGLVGRVRRAPQAGLA